MARSNVIKDCLDLQQIRQRQDELFRSVSLDVYHGCLSGEHLIVKYSSFRSKSLGPSVLTVSVTYKF
ncbi:hypothetical protein O3M35_000604 [Rhynocoris fuscipes]|uniref:Uncharacterized protein n=1 Tax=Rhynocoris fuscipes TaxID=488301 RepID=A0AAW1DNB9_9HEMI